MGSTIGERAKQKKVVSDKEQSLSRLGGIAINLAKILKRLTLGVVLASVPLIGGCGEGNTLTWQEEVKLLDGRVITVTQKRRYESVYTGQDSGSVVREAWLTLKLPEFGNKEIIWHENLETQVLNLHNGKLYIVGIPPTGLEFRQYGKPKPAYIGFRYEDGKWLRIPFADIPEEIYETNMWIDAMPPNKAGHVSLADKAKALSRETLGQYYKRVDPEFKSNFH